MYRASQAKASVHFTGNIRLFHTNVQNAVSDWFAAEHQPMIVSGSLVGTN